MKQLTSIDYNPCGKTALFDAIDTGIRLTNEIKRGSDDRVVAIILTDGEDTASRQSVSTRTIKKEVSKYEGKSDWSFTYIGKPPEYWSRTKPVSKVSYEGNAQRQLYTKVPTTSAVRRLREYNNRKLQQQLLCQ